HLNRLEEDAGLVRSLDDAALVPVEPSFARDAAERHAHELLLAVDVPRDLIVAATVLRCFGRIAAGYKDGRAEDLGVTRQLEFLRGAHRAVGGRRRHRLARDERRGRQGRDPRHDEGHYPVDRSHTRLPSRTARAYHADIPQVRGQLAPASAKLPTPTGMSSGSGTRRRSKAWIDMSMRGVERGARSDLTARR